MDIKNDELCIEMTCPAYTRDHNYGDPQCGFFLTPELELVPKGVTVTTSDGKIVRQGERVFNYYDMEWGVIGTDPDEEGWFYLDSEGEFSQHKLLNGERISTYDPRENRR